MIGEKLGLEFIPDCSNIHKTAAIRDIIKDTHLYYHVASLSKDLMIRHRVSMRVAYSWNDDYYTVSHSSTEAMPPMEERMFKEMGAAHLIKILFQLKRIDRRLNHDIRKH